MHLQCIYIYMHMFIFIYSFNYVFSYWFIYVFILLVYLSMWLYISIDILVYMLHMYIKNIYIYANIVDIYFWSVILATPWNKSLTGYFPVTRIQKMNFEIWYRCNGTWIKWQSDAWVLIVMIMITCIFKPSNHQNAEANEVDADDDIVQPVSAS